MQAGEWFCLPLSNESPAHWDTAWHGGNLYACNAVISGNKLLPSFGSRGDFGIWSHKQSTRSKCGSYMYYIPSGSGVAWSVMYELRVCPHHTRKSGANKDQWVTDEGHVVLHAVWFHGVSQSGFFPGMHIWPTWNAKLEVPP